MTKWLDRTMFWPWENKLMPLIIGTHVPQKITSIPLYVYWSSIRDEFYFSSSRASIVVKKPTHLTYHSTWRGRSSHFRTLLKKYLETCHKLRSKNIKKRTPRTLKCNAMIAKIFLYSSCTYMSTCVKRIKRNKRAHLLWLERKMAGAEQVSRVGFCQ